MIYHEEKVRVRYSETDKMGYVYYGNYASYLEVARVELIRSLGLSYKKMEDEGVMLPIAEYKNKYLRPAYYDDLLTIKTWIREKPGMKLRFDYEIENQEGMLLTVAETTLVFVSMETFKPMQPPQNFIEATQKYFEPARRERKN